MTNPVNREAAILFTVKVSPSTVTCTMLDASPGLPHPLVTGVGSPAVPFWLVVVTATFCPAFTGPRGASACAKAILTSSSVEMPSAVIAVLDTSMTRPVLMFGPQSAALRTTDFPVLGEVTRMWRLTHHPLALVTSTPLIEEPSGLTYGQRMAQYQGSVGLVPCSPVSAIWPVASEVPAPAK